MKPLRIIIDMDGITCDSLPHWLDRIHAQTGVRAKMEDITQWALEKCPPLDQVDPKHIFSRLQDPGFIFSIPPMEGAINVINNLMDDGHEVYLVTARHGPQSMPETLKWVELYLPRIGEKNLVFCYHKHLIPADVIIDDKAETLVKYKLAHPNSLCLGIKYAYNEHLELRGSATDVMLVEYGDTAWATLYQQIVLHAEEP